MAKHHPDLIFCRKQPGVGNNLTIFSRVPNLPNIFFLLQPLAAYAKNATENVSFVTLMSDRVL